MYPRLETESPSPFEHLPTCPYRLRKHVTRSAEDKEYGEEISEDGSEDSSDEGRGSRTPRARPNKGKVSPIPKWVNEGRDLRQHRARPNKGEVSPIPMCLNEGRDLRQPRAWPNKGEVSPIPMCLNEGRDLRQPRAWPNGLTVPSQEVCDCVHSRQRPPEREVPPNSKWNLHNSLKFAVIVLAVAVIAGFCVFSRLKLSEGNRDSDADPDPILVKILSEIKKTFPSQENTLWQKAYSAVITPLNGTPAHPAVLLLLYSDDYTTSDCLVSKIAEKSSQYLQSVTQSPIILDASDSEFKSNILENNDTFIEDYKNKVKDQVTMVLKNLQSLPSVIAEKLHFFCDEIQPLVPKAVYIFTMKVPYSNKKPTYAAEEVFRKSWGEAINPDTLEPLITRLTSEVEFVKPESSLPC